MTPFTTGSAWATSDHRPRPDRLVAGQAATR